MPDANRARVPAGLHAGGQFAAQARTEADVALHDRDGRRVTPAHPSDTQWFLVHDDTGAHARHVTEVAWPREPVDEATEELAAHIESSLQVGEQYNARRIARRLDGAGFRAPHAGALPEGNAAALRDLVAGTFDEGWTTEACARELIGAGVARTARNET